jgi:hypothetical protein
MTSDFTATLISSRLGKTADPTDHSDRPATGKLVVLLGGTDIVDANLELPTQAPVK